MSLILLRYTTMEHLTFTCDALCSAAFPMVTFDGSPTGLLWVAYHDEACEDALRFGLRELRRDALDGF